MRAGSLLAGAYLVAGSVAYAADRPAPDNVDGGGSLVTLWVALAVFAVVAWAIHRLNPLPATVAPWVVPALVGPLALYPLFLHPLEYDSAMSTALAAALWLASGLPLAVAVTGLGPSDRRYLGLAILPGAAIGLLLLIVDPAVGQLPDGPASPGLWVARLLVVTAFAWLPSVGFICTIFGGRRVAGSQSAADVVSQAALLAVCVGPAFTGSVLLVPWETALTLIAVVALVALVGVRAALRPLARQTARAGLERDLAVATSEAERARLAGDLHDGPLQDLLLLARRLEGRDDREGATLARDIADELREVSGDLRLPLLDDLGTGPALEWLTTRVHRLTGLDVTADWQASGRPPAQVELAAFRIAQEAVNNAVRHGRPPIRVTYRATQGDMSLAVEDAGSHPPESGLPEHGRIRLGMLGMTQRAAQIGARLDVHRTAPSGTIVAVEWQAGSPT